MKTTILIMMVVLVLPQPFLNNIGITFSLEGSTLYVPTSGVVAIPGYILNVGFDRYSWLGIQFMTLTSKSNYDVLILQRSATQQSGYYTCSLGDYYISSGRPTQMMSDTVNNMDKIVTSFSNSSQFALTLPRTKGNTNGEDWEGGQFTEMCFFSSDIAFSTTAWSKQYQICSGYSIDSNYSSTFVGFNLGSMLFEGASSIIYGGITGPYLKMILFWYRSGPTINTTLLIRLGSYIASVGYDYYKCDGTDYYGTDPSHLNQDIIYSGYQNGACSLATTATSLRLLFTRDVYTYDDFDTQITSTMPICIIGSLTSCTTVSLQAMYPIMSVQSALATHSSNLSFTAILCLILFMIRM